MFVLPEVLGNELRKYNESIFRELTKGDFFTSVSNNESEYRQCYYIKNNYLTKLAQLQFKQKDILTNFSLNEYVQFSQEHKSLIDDLMDSIIEVYNVPGDLPMGIFWNGAHARISNRLSSDFDLNFIYPEELRNDLYPIEDKICSTLAWVNNKPREYVHAALSCHLNLLRKSDNLNGIDDLMFRVQWAKRDPDILKQYLLNNSRLDCIYPWVSTYHPVKGDNLVDSIFKEVMGTEMNLTKNPDFSSNYNHLINDQLKLLSKHMGFISQIDLKKVKNIKEAYKKRPFSYMFSSLALIRRNLLKDKVDIGSINIPKYMGDENINNLLGNELSSEYFDKIYNYIWQIARLESVFENKRVRFGSHSKQNIDQTFQKDYQDLFPLIGNDFERSHQTNLKDLNSVLIRVYNQLKL